MEIITLKHPVKINGIEVHELKMRSPLTSEVMAASKGKGSDAEQELSLFATLCNCSPKDLSDTHFVDYVKLQKAYKSFLE